MSTTNDALNDECEALNSIYGEGTITVTSSTPSQTTSAVLQFPNQPFSFVLEFAPDYPDVPLTIVGTHSTGDTAKGAGDAALTILHSTVGSVYRPGEVCLFDLIEEAGPALEDISTERHHGEGQDPPKGLEGSRWAVAEPVDDEDHPALTPTTAAAATNRPPPKWTTSESLTVNKSIFVARACAVSSMADVTDAVAHLLASNKKIAGATHNIKAWRFRDESAASAATTQDYDDDGESAAGGRMLHLMQLMDVWNVLVVVTRWYGGVKLGPDRFRVINNVAREALVEGGFVKEEKMKGRK